LLYPSRSSNPFPNGCAGRPCPDAGVGVGAAAPALEAAVALVLLPQMPASLLALAILARSGPFCCDAVVFARPDDAAAVDHREPKTSPLEAAGVVVVGWAVGLPRDAMVVPADEGKVGLL
jgi:hypothetical protein